MSAGPEEPNAFVEVSDPWFDPIVAATMVELVDGLVAEPRAGVGRLPTADVPTRLAEHRNSHVELLVIVSGHDGLYRAEEAAERGERVLLVEQRPEMISGSGTTWRPEGVTYLSRASALGLYDEGYALIHEHTREVDRLWHVRAERIVLATGGYERPIVFADDDRPGIMLSSAATSYLRVGVLPGTRCVLFTARSPAYNSARSLHEAGADVPVIVDVRPDADRAASVGDAEMLAGWVVVGIDGDTRIEGIRLSGPDGDQRTVECDALFVSGGWNPNLMLWRSIGGGVRYDTATASFVPNSDRPPWLSIVGSAAGDVFNDTAYWFVPAEDYSRHFVDFQRDQTIADIAGAVGAGLTSVEHVKRATYIGTAIDQGRTSGVLTAAIVNQLLGAAPDAQGPTSARPPTAPVSYATIAGPDRGDLLDPIRTTRIHPWHEEHGAVFEDVGQWKRPRYFPREDEDMDAAVAHECLAVRNAAGLLDASTLGKIAVIGPDAASFLDRMYTNRMSTLAVGSIRYGFLLGLDGMVADDGVAMRLADDRFFVTTTTGNAAMVLDRFEEWLQTEWPDLRVYCTSVTEQWADVAVAGPRARDVLSALGTDIDLSTDAFPFMTFRDGDVAGIPARVARVSFTGELSYEVLVDGRRALELWEAVVRAGEPLGIQPYGTEAMHVLRAEKGFVIVGQDTDGTVAPDDLGMGWIVRKDDSDFIGRRSLTRADTARIGRKQLVGLLPEELLPEGAQLVEQDTGRIPMPMIGHVTSSYRSPTLGRPIALAMVERGRERFGRTVFAPLPGGTTEMEVVSPVFDDPEGARHDG
jgi:sarcosine oxidase, subunit alpha